MHSKYFVLYGKTLCWYKNADDFIQHANAPLGVVHVAGGVNEWSGRVGLTTASHPFSIPTVEGKTLHCSAPVSHDVAMWNAAFLIGMTMNPMSPERARAAKSRRDSFDLTSPPRAGKQRARYIHHADDSPNHRWHQLAFSRRIRRRLWIQVHIWCTSRRKRQRSRATSSSKGILCRR